MGDHLSVCNGSWFLEAKARKFSRVSVSLAHLTASCSGCCLVLGIEMKEDGYA